MNFVDDGLKLLMTMECLLFVDYLNSFIFVFLSSLFLFSAKTERNRTRSKKLSRHSSRRQQSVRLWGRVPAPCPRGQPSPRFRPPHSNMVHLRWLGLTDSSPNKRRFLFFPDQLWRRKMSSLTPCSLPTTSASLRMSNPRSK